MAIARNALRASPPLLQTWPKGPPGQPSKPPMCSLKSWQGMGPTSLGKPTGKSCLAFALPLPSWVDLL
ncbi:hypothetical protein Pyn_32065 [Prunus yedoensis var. nudiflora]|uniref:Uncharacterized protein n=1 Tax=Prunus yedoensis var. nudiflora TaxID=2094558 RepID=A0A314UWP0_PRUYE|nr:hypothetical protein Pyn_32065 [Prunus yedoensis var. nudiflora]